MTPVELARRQPGVVAGILAAAGLAWWWTVERMAGMDAGPGTDLGTLGWFTGSWVLMMAAMMLPAVAPFASLYSRTFTDGRGARLGAFASGYLIVWTLAALPAYGLAWLTGRLAGGHPAAATVLAVAIFAACGASVLYRMAALREVGRLDESFFMYYEDTDLGWRLRLAGWKTLFEPIGASMVRPTAAALRMFSSRQKVNFGPKSTSAKPVFLP